MPAYVIVNTRVLDPTRIQQYRHLAEQSIQQFGGRYLARGGALSVLEGSYQPERMVLVEFPTLDRAQAWYASEGYAEARRARAGIAEFEMILVEGLP
ncbi:DUF1330 domain-containing protein [Deinococcus radiotolerans]|uniref:DUF1330 domain-containing protein n=1 Tax=Deinococcus radiotolerans TaxID=1309407 RepID=A0ABQ2FRP9_9DEIO|nr:DUF1330 domain-containing protein [Deinococcus radiotolerans]GGL20246.1 hypothetical protein GCM10010844_43900 [Deinococcus radiotolerans]